MNDSTPVSCLCRRDVFRAGALVVAGGSVAACTTAAEGTPNASTPAPATSAPAPATSAASAGPTVAASPAVAAAADIPVGGGKIFDNLGVVVTQPTAGTFKAFSTTCTHEGCPVSQIEGGQIICTCHNSTFDIATGAPTGGPARGPLDPVNVSVDASGVYLT